MREEPGRRLRFLIDLRRTPSESQRTALTVSVESAVGQDFQIAFEVVDRIPPAPSGKQQFVVPLAS